MHNNYIFNEVRRILDDENSLPYKIVKDFIINTDPTALLNPYIYGNMVSTYIDQECSYYLSNYDELEKEFEDFLLDNHIIEVKSDDYETINQLEREFTELNKTLFRYIQIDEDDIIAKNSVSALLVKVFSTRYFSNYWEQTYQDGIEPILKGCTLDDYIEALFESMDIDEIDYIVIGSLASYVYIHHISQEEVSKDYIILFYYIAKKIDELSNS